MIIIIEIIWFLLPAGAANMAAPILTILFPQFSYPLDFKKKFRDKRIFGDNKTFRGLMGGTVIGLFVFLLQKFLFSSSTFFQNISFFDYKNISWIVGVLFGFGALTGDIVKSFFKRQLNIASGKSWFPFDQVDWVVGFLLFIYPFVKMSLNVIILSLILGILLHLAIKFIGFLIKVNKKPI